MMKDVFAAAAAQDAVKILVSLIVIAIFGFFVGFFIGAANAAPQAPVATLQLYSPVEVPNPVVTPGARDPNITLTDICDPVFSRKVRNSIDNMSAYLKGHVYKNYGVTKTTGICAEGRGCVIDHVIPLELGGANDIRNLWVQPLSGVTWNAIKKNELENKLYELVCANRLDLPTAQQALSDNWIKAYQKYVTK